MNKTMGNQATETNQQNLMESGERYEDEVMHAAPGDLSYSFEERVQW